MKHIRFSRKWKSFKKRAPQQLNKLKKPKFFIPIFAVVGALGIALTSAYSIRTQTRVIGISNCNPSSSIRCYDGATNSNGNILFNGDPAPNTPTNNTASGKFYIVGNQIIDPDGNIFYPVGANVAVRQASWAETGFVFNYFGTATGKSTEVQKWGWNTLRVTMVCNASNPSNADTLNGIDALVKEYTAKKIVLMFECHDATMKNLAYSNSTVQNIMNLFDQITDRYKDNPYVWLNPFNEPFASTDVSTWSSFQTSVYNRLRQKASHNIIIADLGGGGNNIDHLVDNNMHATFGAGKCNIMYGWHSYGFIHGFADDAKHKKYIETLNQRKIPVIIGELGDPLRNDGQPLTSSDPPVAGVAGNPDQNRIGARALINYGPANNIGLLWWHATGDTNSSTTYSLTKDKTSPWTVNANNASSKLAVTGKLFWDVSQKTKSKIKFTGNLADSGCASAR